MVTFRRRERLLEFERQQREAVAAIKEAEAAAVKEPTPLPTREVWYLEARDKSAKQGVVWRSITTAETEEAKAAVDRWVKKEDIGGPWDGLRWVKRAEDFQTFQGITEIVQDREARAASQTRKRRAEKARLATQAQEKAEAGEQISGAEREAFTSSLFSVDGKTVTGRSLLIGELLPAEAKRAERKQVLTELQPLISRLQFETPEEARAAGFEVTPAPLLSPISQSSEVALPQAGRGEITFTPDRPIATSETDVRRPFDLTPLRDTTKPRAGTIETSPLLNIQPLIFDKPPTESELLALSTGQRAEREGRVLTGEFGILPLLGLEFVGGVKKVPSILPEAAALGALTLISPPVGLAVGATLTALSIPTFQQEIATKGILRTVASETPTVLTFAAFGGAGARLRTTAKVRETAFDIKLEELSVKDIDPTFTFKKKPFAIIETGKLLFFYPILSSSLFVFIILKSCLCLSSFFEEGKKRLRMGQL